MSTRDLDHGRELMETYKSPLIDAIEQDILRHLESHDTWHSDDLTVTIPADSSNAMPSVVAKLVNTGQIVEVGRRASNDPKRRRETRARKSGVYRRVGAAAPAADPAQSKRWTSQVRWMIAESLVFTEQFRPADLDDLCVPESYRHLIDEAIEAATRRGVMEPDGDGYAITERGKWFLTPMVTNAAEEVDENAPEPEVIELPLDLPPATGHTLGHHESEAA